MVLFSYIVIVKVYNQLCMYFLCQPETQTVARIVTGKLLI